MTTTPSTGKDSPYYYLQGRRVSVVPREDLLAVIYNPKLDGGLVNEAMRAVPLSTTALVPAPDFAEMQRSNVRLFRVAGGPAPSARTFETLRGQNDVQKTGQVFTNDQGQPMVLTDEIVCRFRADMTRDTIDDVLKRFGLEVVETLAFAPNAFVLRQTGRDIRATLDIANSLVEQGHAEYAYPNWIEHVGYRTAGALAVAREAGRAVNPNDPLFAQQWQHVTIKTPDAWSITTGNPAIRLAVLDGGVDIHHEDLNTPGKIVDPADFNVSPPDNDPPADGHGTFVAGMAVAEQNNAKGVSGSAPRCALIAMGAGDTIAQVMMAKAFGYAADHGADVITCSLGPRGAWNMTDALRDAIDYATTYGRGGRGCVYTQAVDNDPNAIIIDQVSAYERSIAVSRTNQAETYDGAAIGPELDVCAPGVGVWSTRPINQYGSSTGTSFATPLTAGVACLVLSVNPTLSWEEVRQVLRDSAAKIGGAAAVYNPTPWGTQSPQFGYGRIDALQAVTLAAQPPPRDLYLRDSPTDSGSVPQPNWGFWDSPDIWIRNADDGGTTHQNTVRGQDNFFHATIRNRGALPSLPCWVRFYLSNWPNTQFVYPYDFKPDTTMAPGGGTPGNLRPEGSFPAQGSYLIGTQRLESVPAGGSLVAKVRWPSALIPPAAGWHPCLLVEISPHDGPTPAGSHVWENNNLGQKNITIVDAARSTIVRLPLRFGHPQLKEKLLSLEVATVKGAVAVKTFVELPDVPLLKNVLANAAVRPLRPIESVVPLRPDLGTLLGSHQPLHISFLEPTRMVVGANDDRSDDATLVLSVPAGASLEIGRRAFAPSADGQDVPQDGDNRATRPQFNLAKLEGKDVLALDPAIRRPRITIPLTDGGSQDAVLAVQVPETAVVGDTLVVDVAQRDARGQLVGGVRLQINVTE